jgi:hypothetical protein
MLKMLTSFAKWAPSKTPVLIHGLECPTGYIPDRTCAANLGLNRGNLNCKACSATSTSEAQQWLQHLVIATAAAAAAAAWAHTC